MLPAPLRPHPPFNQAYLKNHHAGNLPFSPTKQINSPNVIDCIYRKSRFKQTITSHENPACHYPF
jgi:hypothetical protein